VEEGAEENCIMRSFHNSCHSPNIVRVFKPRSLRWAGYIASIGQNSNAHKILIGKPKGKNCLNNLGIHIHI
jgi:hypothetical protein